MARIGIFGTQSVGKTTLLNALRSEPGLKDFTFLTNMTRSVMADGFKINEQGDDRTQMEICRRHAENVILHEHFITDRTMIDCLAYSVYLYRRDRIKKATMENVEKYARHLLPSFTYLIYLPIEFDIVPDGTRSLDPEFRKEIDEIMSDSDTYARFTGNTSIKVHRMSGSVVQRTNKVYELIKGF